MCQSNPAAIPRDCSGCILALKPSPAQRLSHSASYEHPQTLADQATEPGRGLLFSQGVPVDPSGLVGWVGQQRKLVQTAPGVSAFKFGNADEYHAFEVAATPSP